MIIHKFLTQPLNDSRYVSLFDPALLREPFTTFDAAVAYATISGFESLLEVLARHQDWNASQKRWLVGIDWCRTEPLALERLDSISRSDVRVFDGATVVIRRQCVPIVPFHPKAFILRSEHLLCVTSGSGNLSKSGLTLGHEVGSLLAAIRPKNHFERELWNACLEVATWFNWNWRRATPVQQIAARYRQQYENTARVYMPTPLDEDIAPRGTGHRRGLSPQQLRQLRASRNFWIEAGNLHENRGPGQPGNQLMLSRLMRVFFGFPALDLNRDTYIGEVTIEHGVHRRDDCTLRFSNNSMDVLTLPLPGTEGPPKYDQ